MDWEPIVSHLDGRRPALIVDGGGRVRFVNAPMEKLLGRRFDELSTTRWLALCVQPGGSGGREAPARCGLPRRGHRRATCRW